MLSPALLKSAMSVVAGLAGAAAFLPQLHPYQAALSALSAFLLGGAHVPRPGDLQAAKDATSALADALEREK